MYKVKFKMEELMPYESIYKQTLTNKCKKIFNIAGSYGVKNYETEFPYIFFTFEDDKKAFDFYIDTKNLVDYIDIAKGDKILCQEEVN